MAKKEFYKLEAKYKINIGLSVIQILLILEGVYFFSYSKITL
jgi:hypothetical protein